MVNDIEDTYRLKLIVSANPPFFVFHFSTRFHPSFISFSDSWLTWSFATDSGSGVTTTSATTSSFFLGAFFSLLSAFVSLGFGVSTGLSSTYFWATLGLTSWTFSLFLAVVTATGFVSTTGFATTFAGVAGFESDFPGATGFY